MIKMSVTEAASILGLPTINNDIEFKGICIDTRTLVPGNMFIALPGNNTDGHQYVEEARLKGAICALVSRKVESPIPQIQVKDIVEAMGKLTAAWRDKFNLPIIAATGSNGKTTLKNMIANILASACAGEQEVLATQGNLNNHLGLPLTLARLDAEHKFAVLEMGMNHFGEIRYLTHLAKPSVAVITNAGATHLEGVGDLAGVARAKAEIFEGLSAKGIAILNRDDNFYDFWREKIGNLRSITFGFHEKADVTIARDFHSPSVIHNTQRILLNTPKGNIEINLPLLGRHNIMNTLAAAASTLAIGIELSAIKAGIERIKPAPGRLQLHMLENGVKIIDDTYNANPYSLSAALDAIRVFGGKKILVLGDMKELGEDAKKIHHTVGEEIRHAGIDYLFTYGELSANTSISFGEGAYHFNEQEKLINALKPFLYNAATILIKGSRSMHMEKVVAGLVR